VVLPLSYLIDGHNLIPKIDGLSLKMADDEDRLIELLQVFAQNKRKTIEVFFDRASPGYAGKQQKGRVRVVFVRSGMTADQAIVQRLRQLKDRKNWTVVSSDRQVQSSAKNAGAAVLSSEAFARLLSTPPTGREEDIKPDADRMSSTDIEVWQEIFKSDQPEQSE